MVARLQLLLLVVARLQLQLLVARERARARLQLQLLVDRERERARARIWWIPGSVHTAEHTRKRKLWARGRDWTRMPS